MYKVLIIDSTYSQIDNFINSFSSNFVKMYTNTWMHDEDLIQNSYIELWERLRELIIMNIKDKFIVDTILWTHISEWWKQYITISINNFRLFVYYIEEREENLRIIENIEIFKK